MNYDYDWQRHTITLFVEPSETLCLSLDRPSETHRLISKSCIYSSVKRLPHLLVIPHMLLLLHLFNWQRLFPLDFTFIHFGRSF